MRCVEANFEPSDTNKGSLIKFYMTLFIELSQCSSYYLDKITGVFSIWIFNYVASSALLQ